MNDTHSDKLFRALLAGQALSESDLAHARTCAPCRQAIGDFEEFETDLGRTARGLAVEPLPDGLLDRDLSPRPTWPRVALPAIAGLLAIAAVVGLSRLSATPPLGVASPFPSPSQTTDSPHQSATPPIESTPPPDSAPPGEFVRGAYSCGDGLGGFIVWIPRGWYANSAHDGVPACRFVSTEQFIVDGIDDPPSVPITLSVRSGDYLSTGDEVERTERSLDGGVPALRIVEVAENGRRLIYVVALDGSLPSAGNPDRYLLAMTMFGDATFDRDRAALDEMFTRFGLQDPYVHDSAAVAQAHTLYAQTLTCTNAELRFEVQYPVSWFTNPVTADLPACTWFGPIEFAAANGSDRPPSAVIGLRVLHSAFGSFGPGFLYENQSVGGRPAERTERYAGTPSEPDTSFRTYQFLVLFGESITGPNLLATTDTSVSFDYDVAKEVLDRMMASLSRLE